MHSVEKLYKKLIYNKLELDIDISSSDCTGNKASIAIPLVLAMSTNSFKPMTYLALLGIGSGMNSIVLGIKW